MDATGFAVAAALVGAVAIGCVAAVRVVPAGHRGVVTRAGRAVRSRPPGLVVLAPGVERVQMVTMHPSAIDPLSVTGRTRDGVEVRLVLSVLWCVAEPSLAVQEVRDPRDATADAIERAVHHLVATVDLARLLHDRELILSRLLVTALPVVSPFGVHVIDVDLLDAQVRVGPELLRLLA